MTKPLLEYLPVELQLSYTTHVPPALNPTPPDKVRKGIESRARTLIKDPTTTYNNRTVHPKRVGRYTQPYASNVEFLGDVPPFIYMDKTEYLKSVPLHALVIEILHTTSHPLTAIELNVALFRKHKLTIRIESFRSSLNHMMDKDLIEVSEFGTGIDRQHLYVIRDKSKLLRPTQT